MSFRAFKTLTRSVRLRALAELGPSVMEITSIRVCHSRPISRESGIMFSESRVERWRGGLGRSWFSLLARPFVCECHNISTMLRFHLPLIKPDVRISRIRLSDKDSRFRSREVTLDPRESDQSEFKGEVLSRES